MSLLTENQQNRLLEELLKSYSEKREKNSAYSLRSFSKKIGVSSGALSEIFSKKRQLKKKSALKILKNLSYSDKEAEMFLDQKNKKSGRNYSDLSIDQYQVLSNWQYLALLNLIELQDIEHTSLNFSKSLNIHVSKIEEILERLMKLEMLEFKDGKFIRTHVRYQTTEDIANSAIKKYHLDTLELGEKALRELSPELRDFSSIVMKMNHKNMKKIKEMIRNFQDEVSEIVEGDDPQDIFHLNVQLYPVTSNEDKNGERHV